MQSVAVISFLPTKASCSFSLVTAGCYLVSGGVFIIYYKIKSLKKKKKKKKITSGSYNKVQNTALITGRVSLLSLAALLP